jgi:hypothetical protein
LLALGFLLTGGLTGAASANAASGAETRPAPQPVEMAQAKPAERGGETKDTSALSERVNALEKENVVLREDVGKARLDTRVQLEELAKRQAETIAKLKRDLEELDRKMEAERQAQARRNRNLWLAVGVAAVGVLLAK